MAKPQLAAITPEQPQLETRIDEMRQREQAPRISIWEPAETKQSAPASITIPIEHAIIAAIEAPLHLGEAHREGNDRKEREIAALFATLTPAQSLALSRRLSAARQDDVLVAAFGRLVVERRTRLLARLQRGRAIAATIAQRPR